ncbi:two-component system response regulator [Planctomycetales bacterium]|nr:two-component system response regulator [Planctomycetales bacterium]
MKIISLEEAQPGQVLAQEIKRCNSLLWLRQGTKLTEPLLRALKGLSIKFVIIEDGRSTEAEQKKILLVDDNMTNLTTGKDILKDQYKVYQAPSAEIMFDLMEHIVPDMILLDIEMPDMNGYEAIKRLKSEPLREAIPVIFLTSKTDEDSELEGLSLGAVDYITKPFSAPILLKRIENHLIIETQKNQLREFNILLEKMVIQKSAQVLGLQNAVLSTVADLVEFRDNVTGGHISRTQKFLQILVSKLVANKIYADEISGWDMDYLLPSAQLHDVGKLAISDLILNKSDRLTLEEWNVMKTHVTFGVDAITKIEENTNGHTFLRHAKRIIASHHEKWDGTGYPSGISGRDIPLEGRLMAIADVYDALVSTRPYKKPISTEMAQKIIEGGSGTHFDPVLVEVFSSVANQFSAAARDTLFAKKLLILPRLAETPTVSEKEKNYEKLQP